jgi:hypothetical protein
LRRSPQPNVIVDYYRERNRQRELLEKYLAEKKKA